MQASGSRRPSSSWARISSATARPLAASRRPDQGDPALAFALVHQLRVAHPRLEVHQLVRGDAQRVQRLRQLGDRVDLDGLPAAAARTARAARRRLLGGPGRRALARGAATRRPAAAARRAWRPGGPAPAAAALPAGPTAAAATTAAAPAATSRPTLVCHLVPPAPRPRSRVANGPLAGRPAPALYHTPARRPAAGAHVDANRLDLRALAGRATVGCGDWRPRGGVWRLPARAEKGQRSCNRPAPTSIPC